MMAKSVEEEKAKYHQPRLELGKRWKIENSCLAEKAQLPSDEKEKIKEFLPSHSEHRMRKIIKDLNAAVSNKTHSILENKDTFRPFPI